MRPEDFTAEVAQVWRLARDLTDDSMNAAFRRAAHAQQVKHIEIEDPFAVAHILRMQAVDDHIKTGNHTKAAEEYETLATEYAKLLDLDTTGNAPLSPPTRRHLTRYRADALSMAGVAYARANSKRDALAHSSEALRIMRQLIVQPAGTTYLDNDLAVAATRYAAIRSHLGVDLDAAADVITEAVRLHDALAANRPDEYGEALVFTRGLADTIARQRGG